MDSSHLHTQNTLETCGVSIPFDRRVITPPIEQAIRANLFEAEEAAQIPKIVSQGDTVLDIGAGIGFISTLLARQPEVERVVAVEANPDLMPFMAKLHDLNGVENIERMNVILTNDASSEMTFYQRKDFWMGSLMAGPNAFETRVQVKTSNLDRFLNDQKITLIVCDIEGAESVIFRDADLSGVDRLYLELHDHITGLKGIHAVFTQMGEKGFAYDPRSSSGAIVLFRRVQENEVLRPYARGES
ncbi:MAG: FkbM family methyltransferase [Rhodobacteraceae bacterium]|nr:FkbM family methyltransferase [Paracoccaceae bacterium]